MNREPLLRKSLWVALVTAVLAVLIAAGVPIGAELRAAIIALVGVAAPLLAAIWARPDVTPVSDPRDANGQPLTPEGNDYE